MPSVGRKLAVLLGLLGVIAVESTNGAEPATVARPFRAAMLERERVNGDLRVRLLVYTRGVHERDGQSIFVFSNELGRSAVAQERRKCECDGLWVVNTETRRGRRLLRGMRQKMREQGRAKFGALVRDGAGEAGFRIGRYNRKFEPFEVAD